MSGTLFNLPGFNPRGSRAAGAPGRMHVANRADGGQGSLSSGSSTQLTYSTKFTALCDCHSIQLVFANYQVASGGEQTPADDLTVHAAFVKSDGTTIYQAYLSATAAMTVNAGQIITTDVIPVRLSAGDTFYIRARPLVDVLGKKWPIGGPSNPGSGGAGHASGSVVLTAAQADFTGSAVPFQPVAVLGIPVSPAAKCAVVLGDSTAYGSGDTSNIMDYGHVCRALATARVPHHRLAASGLPIATILSSGYTAMIENEVVYQKALLALTKPSFAVISFGNNDIHNSGNDLGECQAFMTSYLDFVAGLGMDIVVLTITPRSTSSDSWATVANQTANAESSKRQEFNAWLKTRPHDAIIAVWDVAALVEDATVTSKFRTTGGAWTADGTHLNPLGHATVAAGIAGDAAALAALCS